ncbi:MAG: septum formation initiator family protein [bacterium]|nr:septum formation initiator family protein [bacterium]
MPRLGWGAAITVVAGLFALALLHAIIVDRQATLDSLNEQIEDVRAVNDRLRLNVARAEAPERIMAEARYRLGMVEPDRRIYLSPLELGGSGAR